MANELDDTLSEDATVIYHNAPECEPWLSAEMVPDHDAPCGREAFQIIDLNGSTGS